MYRLPTQFDASASRQDLAAAGGGSTSTTCSSCIVTLLGTSVLSAVVLGGLEPIAPAAAGSETRATVDTVATDTDLHTPPPPSLQQPAIAPDPDLAAPATSAAPVVGMSRTGRILLGLFALPLAAVGGGIFMAPPTRSSACSSPSGCTSACTPSSTSARGGRSGAASASASACCWACSPSAHSR